MASIGSLTADLRLESAAFIRDMGRAQRAVASNTAAMRRSLRQVESATRGVQRQFSQLRGAAVALAGALAVRQFTSFTRAALDSADAIAKQADRVGVSTKNLQELRLAAQLTGVDVEKLDQGIGAFTKRLGELRAGSGALATLLNKTNVELKNQLIAATSTGEAFNIFLKALAETRNQADRVALSAAGVSRTVGIELSNLVREGAEATQALRDRMSELGLVMEERVLRAAERVKDDLTLLNQAFRTGFDTAIIRGLANSVDAGAESLREAREIGEEFGRAVGFAMRGVAAAAKFVAENIRAIAAVLAGLIALKAAAIVTGLAVAFVRLASAMKAAAATAGALAAIQAGLKKGLLGIAAATAAIAATLEALAQVDPEITKAIDAFKNLGAAGEAAGDGITAADRAIGKANGDLAVHITQTRTLIASLKKGGDAYRRNKREFDLLNQAVREGIDVTTKQGRAWLELARDAAALDDELRKLQDDHRKAAEAAAEQARQARELALEPFRNALRGIQDAFTDTFEQIFSGGVDSFRDLASAAKRIMIRLAAEIATLLVFRPVVASALGAAGFGGAAAALGAGAAGSTGGGGGFLSGTALTASFLPQFAKDALFEVGSFFDPTGAFGVDLVNAFNPANALAGFGGSLAASLLGLSNGIGSTIGSTLGGIAGGIVGGPIGAFVGAFGGSALGGIFGGKPSVGPGAGINLVGAGGRFAPGLAGADNGATVGFVTQLAETATDLANGILERLGAGIAASAPGTALLGILDFPKYGGLITSASGDTASATRPGARPLGADPEKLVNDAVIRLFASAIAGGALEGLSDELATAIRRSAQTVDPGDLAQFASDIDLAMVALGEGAKEVSAFDQALEEIRDRFAELTARAKELELPLENVNRQRYFEVQALKLQARAPLVAGAEAVAGYLRGAAVQFASPADQLRAAQARFGELLAQVRGGDSGAVQGLLQSADAVRGLARQNFASSVDFQNIDLFVRRSLASVGETLLSEEYFDRTIEATRQSAQSRDELLRENNALLEDVRRELQAQRREARQAA